MKLLVVKLSSLGDILHLLPALTDVRQRFPQLRADWVVEPAFAEIPTWHPLVERSIPVGLRRLKKNWWQAPARFWHWRQALRSGQYSRVVDAQGLVKSALLSRLADAPVFGLDPDSAREGWASRFYQKSYAADWSVHAITRNRRLFAQVMDYGIDESVIDYGLAPFAQRMRALPPDELTPFVSHPFILGIHGTTWSSKHWPEAYWQGLVPLLAEAGLRLLLPWGSRAERERALRIQAVAPAQVQVLPRLRLGQLARLFVRARAFVGVDSGLSHLGAALGVPGVSLYGPTSAVMTGVQGAEQHHLSPSLPCAPCLERVCTQPPTPDGLIPCHAQLTPQRVWDALAQARENHEK